MQSTLNPKQTDPHADPHDAVTVAREEFSNVADDAMRYPSDAQSHVGSDFSGSDFSAGLSVPPVDTTFRATAVNQGLRPSIGVRAVRAFIGFVLAVCIGVAGVVWQAYGDAAKQMMARWTPQLVATSSPPLENAGLSEQPSPPAVQANAAGAAPPQPAPLAQPASEGVTPTAAATSAEAAQLLQSMARDLVAVRQEIDQLKASQDQLSRDIAKASQPDVAKASQPKPYEAKPYETKPYEARAYDAKAYAARASEHNLRPKISAPPQRTAAAPARRPMPPPYPPPQTAAAPLLPQTAAPYVPRPPDPQPQATAQPQAEPEFSPVPRPPMPVR
jgi:hypothetical protein